MMSPSVSRFVALLIVCVCAEEEGRWASLETPPADSILGLKAAYLADPDEKKIELTIGAYRDDAGKPWVLEPVRKAKQDLSALGSDWTHEYLPIEGYGPFLRGSEELLYGETMNTTNKISSQALSGTGALRLAFEFLVRHWHTSKLVYIPGITWANHWNIARDAGLEAKGYRYLLPGTTQLDVEGMLEDLRSAPMGSILLLHLCAHNPTGVDPDRDTWTKIATIVSERKLFPLFDSAYLGFASGDVDYDAYPFRFFVDLGLAPWACVSFSKNFGLYSERVGAVHATLTNHNEAPKVLGHLKKIARAMYSNPPAFGARIVAHVLHEPDLKASWQASLKLMATRIQSMRTQLRQHLESRLLHSNKYSDWSHITSQIGMFSFTGLEPHHVHTLRAKHHVYILDNGRISMAGLNQHNLLKFVDAVVDVLTASAEDHGSQYNNPYSAEESTDANAQHAAPNSEL